MVAAPLSEQTITTGETWVGAFWEISAKGTLQISVPGIYDMLARKGYRVKDTNGQMILYRLDGYILQEVEVTALIAELIRFMKVYKKTTHRLIEHSRIPDELVEFPPHKVLDKLTDYGFGRIFTEANWKFLPELEKTIKKHTRDQAFFYFKNEFVSVSKHAVMIHTYDILKHKNECIFADWIVDRSISLVKIDDKENQTAPDHATRPKGGPSFYHFLHMISGTARPLPDHSPSDTLMLPYEYETNSDKLNYLMAILGYLLHNYREKGKTDWGAVLCDDNVGGTGKGTLVQALEKLTALALLPCDLELFKFDTPGKMTTATRIKVYNDVPGEFKLKSIYNEITDVGRIEYKNAQPILVEYEETWKSLITTNFVVKGDEGHSQRRIRVFNMTPFFHKNRTIADYYGHTFFSQDWTDEDWTFFYNVMFECVKIWFSKNYKVYYVDADYEERKLDANYSYEFRQYVDSLEPGLYQTGSLYEGFKNHKEYGARDSVRHMTSNRFGKLLTSYLDSTGRPYQRNSNRVLITIGKLPTPAPTANPKDQMNMF